MGTLKDLLQLRWGALEEEFDFHPAFEPIALRQHAVKLYGDTFRAVAEGADTMHVAYVTREEDPAPFWGTQDDGSLMLFGRIVDREAFVGSAGKAKTPLVHVREVQRGAGQGSTVEITDAPAAGRDGASGVYVPSPRYLEEHYRPLLRTRGKPEATAVLREHAAATLLAYQQHQAGEVYGVVRETWRRDPDTGVPELDEDTVAWGIVGIDDAASYLIEDAMADLPAPTRSDLADSPAP